jgi:hypothetical protein
MKFTLFPKNKKGILVIIEAAIAILLLLGFTAVVMTKQVQQPDTAANVYQIQHQILREISGNYSLRDEIINGNIDKTNITKGFITGRLKPFPVSFSVVSCNPGESCSCIECPGEKEIFADDAIISTNLSNYAEKKLALFVWLK